MLSVAKRFLQHQRQLFPEKVNTTYTLNTETNPVHLEVGKTYTLSKPDMLYCITKGKERYWNDHKVGIVDQRYKLSRSGMDLDIQGMFGELGMHRLLGVTDLDHLNNTTPQGIHNDRGDLIVEGEKIDVKTCLGGSSNDLWVRLNSLKNPSSVYVLLTFGRGPQALERKNKNDNSEITFVPEEEIVLTFQGAVTAYDLFQEENLQQGRWESKYVYDRTKLINLETALDRFKKQHVLYMGQVSTLSNASFY